MRLSKSFAQGWSSILHWNGSQHRMATFIRTDGNSETAMGLASAAALLNAPLHDAAQQQQRQRWLEAAAAISDYLWRWSDSQTLGDPTDPAHGIVWWCSPAFPLSCCLLRLLMRCFVVGHRNQQTPGPFAKWASVDYG